MPLARASRLNLRAGLERGADEHQRMMEVLLPSRRRDRRWIPHGIAGRRHRVRDVAVDPRDETLRCRHRGDEGGRARLLLDRTHRSEIDPAADLADVEARQRRTRRERLSKVVRATRAFEGE